MKTVQSVLQLSIIAICLYVFITCSIYRFKNPQMTETQLFLSIPKALMLEFSSYEMQFIIQDDLSELTNFKVTVKEVDLNKQGAK